MKKRLFAIALSTAMLAVSSFVGAKSAMAANADGSEPEVSASEPVVEPEPAAKLSYKVFHVDESSGERIEDPNNKYGDVLISSYEGEVGESVVAVVQGNPTMEVRGKQASLFRYIIKTVWFNGAAIQATDAEKGEYTVTLVEGNNVLEVDFSGKAEISVMDLAGLNWQALLTVDNLMRLIVLAVLLLVSSGFFISLIKGKKIKSETTEEIAEAVKKIVMAQTKDFLNNDVKPLLETQTGMSKEAAEATSVIMRVTLLAQENTPEARLEIIKELQKYKSTDAELAKKIEEIVNSSIERREKAESDAKEAIEKTKEAIRDLKPIEEEGDGGFGSL